MLNHLSKSSMNHPTYPGGPESAADGHGKLDEPADHQASRDLRQRGEQVIDGGSKLYR